MPVRRKSFRCSSAFRVRFGREMVVGLGGVAKIGGAVPPAGGLRRRRSACIVEVSVRGVVLRDCLVNVQCQATSIAAREAREHFHSNCH